MSEDIPITFFKAFFDAERIKRRFKTDEELLRQSVKDTTRIYGTLLTPDGGDVSGAILSGGGGGADEAAIHSDVANEINLITEKTILVDADKILIEDSEDNHNKKMIQLTNIVDSLLTEILALGIKVNDLENPDADVNWVFANKHFHITFTNPVTESGVILELLGNTSGKDLLHLHQHTGNPTGETRLQHLEWDHENVIPVRWKNGDTAFYLYFDMIAPSEDRLITYPDKDLSFAVDTVAEAIAAVEAADPLNLAGAVKNPADNKGFYTGASGDFRMYHNGTHSYIINTTGELIIVNNSGGGIQLHLTEKILMRDTGDSNAVLFRLDTTARIFEIGNNADPMVSTFNGDVNVKAGSINMDGSGSDDEALKLPYLTQAPATLANGMMWMEADGTHIYRDGVEKILAEL